MGNIGLCSELPSSIGQQCRLKADASAPLCQCMPGSCTPTHAQLLGKLGLQLHRYQCVYVVSACPIPMQISFWRLESTQGQPGSSPPLLWATQGPGPMCSALSQHMGSPQKKVCAEHNKACYCYTAFCATPTTELTAVPTASYVNHTSPPLQFKFQSPTSHSRHLLHPW